MVRQQLSPQKRLLPQIRTNAVIKSPLGDFALSFSATGLCRISFPDTHNAKTSINPKDKHLVSVVSDWFDSYWAKTPDASLLARIPLDLNINTTFQQTVLQALCQIPFGTTSTYARIARQCAGPNHCRAVANACGSNPVPVLIPCHRIIRTDSTLGGFSSGAGWKQHLLVHENVL